MKANWKPLKVLFVGDEPSSKNKSPDVPFVGTPSYKRLLRWIGELDLDIHRVDIINSDKSEVRTDWVPAKIIFLGKKAQIKFESVPPKFLVYSDMGYMSLGKHQFNYDTVPKIVIDHPSPRNRKFNKPGYESKMLKDLKRWLYE